MTVLVYSEASFNVSTKAIVARNSALYASALEASHDNTDVSVRLATGSIVSTRKVVLPLKVKFDDLDSVEPFIVLDMDDRYDLILGRPWLEMHEPWIDWRRRTIGEQHIVGTSEVLTTPSPYSPRALELGEDGTQDSQTPSPNPMGIQGPVGSNRVTRAPGAVDSSGANAARASHGDGGAGVDTRAEDGGRVGTPITQGVGAGSAHADVRAGARADNSGRVGTPTTQGVIAGSARAKGRGEHGVCAPKDETLRILDVLTGKPKVGVTLAPLTSVAELLELEELSYLDFLESLKAGELEEVVLVRAEHCSGELNSSSVMDPEVLEDERTSWRKMRYGSAILQDTSDPYYGLIKEFSNVVNDDHPSVLPPDRGVRHEIDLVPGTKYCTTRQWPLPKEQVDVIDAFFAAKHAAGMVRVSKSPHSSPTFCVRKSNGKWRMFMQRRVDGYYHLLMRESDIPLTAVSTPSGMLREWLIMPQGLSNAPATLNRLVTQLFRPMRHFEQTYYDIFVHSRASAEKTAIEVHLDHLRDVLLCMRENRLYANINKCIFGAEAIPFLGCFLGKDGVRADPDKVSAIAQWPVPTSQKDLRMWLGLANYLLKYSANYAEMAPFEAINHNLQSAPTLALPDDVHPFSVVCDGSDFAIGCALLQADAEGRERVMAIQSRQLKAAERTAPSTTKRS
ncbi:unnamed protein product [Phytophthora fragariaefolia]|uniref:Unnamed protein product n=1 Tax=Phytophthora fragariaefolia TaxID=1490495 RepID=A0A9W7D0Z6_9STRA|nr:unnamed protein product [Phytophthora fragariaefolia]